MLEIYLDYVFKIILVGDSSTGKSCLIERVDKNKFNPNSKSTIGVDFKKKVFLYNGKNVETIIWDTCGQERYRAISKTYYRSSDAAILVYDITNRTSFKNLDKWLNEIRDVDEGMKIILVGNKSDSEENRSVKFNEGLEYSKKNNLIFLEASAKNDFNVNEIFDIIVKELVLKMKSQNIESNLYIKEENELLIKEKKEYCSC